MDFSMIWAWMSSGAGLWGTSGLVVIIVAFILNKYVDDSLWDKVGKFVYRGFYIVCDKISRYLNQVTVGVWNKLIEPVIKIAIRTIGKNAISGSIDGLDADNDGSKPPETPKPPK